MFEEGEEVLELELVSEVLLVETIAVIFPSSPELKPKSCWIAGLAFFPPFFFWNLFGSISG